MKIAKLAEFSFFPHLFYKNNKKNQSGDSSNTKFGKIKMQINKTTIAINCIQPWKLLTRGGSLKKQPILDRWSRVFRGFVLFLKEPKIRSLFLCKYELCWPTFLIIAVKFILYRYTAISMSFTSTLCV